MGKLVVLKMRDGNFEQGFTVTLQMGGDGEYPSLEIVGKLPKAPEIPQLYRNWQSTYRKFGSRYRITAKPAQLTNVSQLENCSNCADLLRNAINLWLQSEPFRPIREKLLEQLAPSDEIRVLVQTDDIWLQRLPWHLWDLCQRYPKAEIALSTAVYERVEQISPSRSKVRILAIIGNSTGINTQADRLLLEQLPDAEIRFLVEPQHQELNEQLWQQGWDILFFAGHSGTQANSGTGKISINQTDSLTIEQLKYAIEKAVERGLKIAFFNSCDGLGLGRELADLRIPQTILMREPVPDRVAQEFLKGFLEAFARGETFYLAVREGRERLQGLESQFPCATWLPMICQNPAVIPPTWQKLCGREPPTHSRALPKKPSFLSSYRLRALVFASVIVTSMLVGIRHLGMLQRWELQDFDRSIQMRPEEGRDGRILIVAITEEDFQLPEQKQRIGSLSDLALAKLLEKLAQFKPRAIGLDIYRDRPVDIKQPKLANFLKHNDNFFAICKVSDSKANEPGVSPPPEVPIHRQGFSDLIVDPDGILRRHLIAMKPSSTSPCTTPYALSIELALHYLEAEGISTKYTPNRELQVGKIVLKRWHNHLGGYQQVDDWGYQILLNYRSYHSPEEIAEQVTLKDVLTGKLKPDTVKNRIVIIGITANSAGDFFSTPYSAARGFYHQMPGVVVHAQMVSQILSAVKDGQPLLWVLPQWGETLWIWGWSMWGGVLAWRICDPRRLGLAAGCSLGILYGIGFAAIVQGCWLPLVPSALAFVVTGASVLVSSYYQPSEKV